MMFHSTAKEIRRHPGRFVPTLIAIAVSVMFFVAVAVITTNEQYAAGRQATLGLAKADLVVSVQPDGSNTPSDATVTTVQTAIAGVKDVSVVNHNLTSFNVLSKDDKSQQVQLVSLPPTQLRSDLVTGQWPRTGSEIALGQSLAEALGVTVGDTVSLSYRINSNGDPMAFTVSGTTNDPSTVFSGTGYVSTSWFSVNVPTDSPTGDFGVVLAPGADRAAVVDALRTAVEAPGYTVNVVSADQAVADAADSSTGSFGLWNLLLWAFAVVALVVGVVTIAATFFMSMNRRRREIGLLRAAGASAGQVRRTLMAEALWLGVVGSLIGVVLGLGVSVGGAAFTGALAWGFSFPWLLVAGAFVVGVVITMIAAVAPMRQALRRPPMEVLRPDVANESLHKSGVRRVLGWVALVAGVAMIVASLVVPLPATQVVGAATIGCVLVAVAVLLAAVWYVPRLIRLFGAPARGVPGRLAVANLLRDGRRTVGAVTALVLAVGLVVGMQVASASVRESVMTQADTATTVDLSVMATGSSDKGVPNAVPLQTLRALAAIPGVASSITLSGVSATDDRGGTWLALGYNSDVAKRGRNVPPSIPTDGALAPRGSFGSQPVDVEFKGPRGTMKLTVTESDVAQPGQLFVSPQALNALGNPTTSVGMWLSLADQTLAPQAASQAQQIVAGQPGLALEGGALSSGATQNSIFLLNGLAAVLIAVAFVVVIVGTGNVLMLSVRERERESALMRALGLRKSHLRKMIRTEALLQCVVGLVVGIVAGGLLGWVVANAVSRAVGGGALAGFHIDWQWPVALIVLVVVAALVASVAPGRRAAKVEPLVLVSE